MKVNTIIVALLLMLAVTPAHAERIIGILSIPSIFAYTSEVTETPKLNVFDAPQSSAKVLAVVNREVVTSPDIADLYLPEVSYEETGFEVLARQDGWYEVLLRRANTTDTLTGWVLPPADAVYTELTSFLQDALLAFTDAWDGTLYVSPASLDKATIKPQNPALLASLRGGPDEPPLTPYQARVNDVDVRSATVVDGQTWLNVVLRNSCIDDNEVYGTGWVKLPDDWRVLFSHFSRGC